MSDAVRLQGRKDALGHRGGDPARVSRPGSILPDRVVSPPVTCPAGRPIVAYGPVELSSKAPPELRAVWRIIREYPRDAPRVVSAAVAALPVLVLVTMGYARRWVTEDAFIDLRIVRHLLAGHGPVFNIGERVEAYTSPLWVALLAAAGFLGAPLEVGAVALGLALSITGLLLAQAGAWSLASRMHRGVDGASGQPGDGSLALPLGAAVFVALPVVWDFTTSGLESGLVIAWLGAVFWLLVRSRPMNFRRSCVAAFTIGCGPLVRPDLALFSMGFGAALALIVRWESDRGPSPWEWTKLGIVAAALPIGCQVFRMGYFAALVPNTALAKEASAAYWRQGWRYAWDFVGTYALWLPLPVVGAWAVALVRSARRSGDQPTAVLVLAPMLSALAHWLYIIRVGGDFMHGRLLLPGLFGFLLPLATVVVPARVHREWRVVALAGVAGWAVACGLWLRVPYAGEGMPGPWGIADERGFYTHHMNMPNPIRIGDYLRHPYVARVNQMLLSHDRALFLDTGPEGLAFAAPLASRVPRSIRVVLGLTNIGVLGYIAGPDVRVIDRLGLSDPIASRLLLADRGRPGHEKLLPEAWIVARFGDAEAAARFPGAREAALALTCGGLARLLRAMDGPLTPARFLANVRAAWALHRLRLPADPVAARERFCSPVQPAQRSLDADLGGSKTALRIS
jgi:arabinofuranosyltransferase